MEFIKQEPNGLESDIKKIMNKHLPLKESLFLGFCAVLILCTKAALRLHIHIPGHSMLFTIFFLMLVRACVSYRLSASFTGLLAGLMAMVLGMGKGGPLILLKFVLPAIIIDVSVLILPLMFESFILCAIVACAASATKFISIYIVDTLIGMDSTVVIQHALLKSSFSVGFGVLGSLFIPLVVKKLKAQGVI